MKVSNNISPKPTSFKAVLKCDGEIFSKKFIKKARKIAADATSNPDNVVEIISPGAYATIKLYNASNPSYSWQSRKIGRLPENASKRKIEKLYLKSLEGLKALFKVFNSPNLTL